LLDNGISPTRTDRVVKESLQKSGVFSKEQTLSEIMVHKRDCANGSGRRGRLVGKREGKHGPVAEWRGKISAAA